MIIRLVIVWALLNISCLIYEIMQYQKSKRWGWKWWFDSHLCALTEFLFISDIVILVLAIILWIATGFNFTQL